MSNTATATATKGNVNLFERQSVKQSTLDELRAILKDNNFSLTSSRRKVDNAIADSYKDGDALRIGIYKDGDAFIAVWQGDKQDADFGIRLSHKYVRQLKSVMPWLENTLFYGFKHSKNNYSELRKSFTALEDVTTWIKSFYAYIDAYTQSTATATEVKTS